MSTRCRISSPYCTTGNGPELSSSSRGNSSSRVTSSSGIAIRPPSWSENTSRDTPSTSVSSWSSYSVAELALLGRREHVGAPGEPEHVEDQPDAAVAQDRGAGERVDGLEIGADAA